MYRLYTSHTHFALKKESAKNDPALVIDRNDTGINLMNFQDTKNLGFSSYAKVVDCFLGILRLSNEVFLVIATGATQVAVIAGAKIYKISSVDFISYRTGSGVRQQISGNGGGQVSLETLPSLHVFELLNSGHFFYSLDDDKYDLTLTLQTQRSPDFAWDVPSWDRADKKFFWNKHLMRDIINLRLNGWCVPVIDGFIETKQAGHINGKTLELVLVSRRSRFRAGTRYNTRGVDDDGNVANFVESEQIACIDGMTLCHTQIRGSVPVFWEQESPQLSKMDLTKLSNLSKVASKVGNRIILTRPATSTATAFQQHFRDITNLYGNVVIVNLLSAKKEGEKLLTDAYENHLKTQMNPAVRYIHFDFHEHVKGNKVDKLDALCKQLFFDQSLLPTGFCLIDGNGKIVIRQTGAIRTNCKDCLDRTNIVQSQISFRVLEAQLKKLDILRNNHYLDDFSGLVVMFKTLWANNGDDLSIQYAGSGSLKSGLTRTGEYGIKTILEDGKKNLTRFYMNNFKDDDRQIAIDQLLGLHETVKQVSHQNAALEQQLQARSSEFVQTSTASVFVATFNVGGQDPGGESITPWLDAQPFGFVLPDIYAIGIQEVVELTPGKVLATDPARGEIWEKELKKAIAHVANKQVYVLLQSHQLVGLLHCIFVKAELVPSIRHVAYEITKTGLKGMVGNKGGIAIRFSLFNTSFCFVTAHLAAGQEGFDDRNNDYNQILNETAFGRQRQVKIMDHDYIFWFGDFNYRIDLSDEEVRQAINDKNYLPLAQADQLLKARAMGLAFQGFQESTIGFDPTYKYDLNSTIYDTSPKTRIPAWTDRILFKASNPTKVALQFYTRTEILLSDHRPVSAYFNLEVTKTDKNKEKEVRRAILGGVSQVAQSTGTMVSDVPSMIDFDFMDKDTDIWTDASFTPVVIPITSYTPAISRQSIAPISSSTPVFLDPQTQNTTNPPSQLYNPFMNQSQQNPPITLQNPPIQPQSSNLPAFHPFPNNQDSNSNPNPFSHSDIIISQNPNVPSLQNNNPFSTSAPPLLPPRPHSTQKNPFLPSQQQIQPSPQFPAPPILKPQSQPQPQPQFNDSRFSLSSYPPQVSSQPSLFPTPPSQNQYPAQFIPQQVPNNNPTYNQQPQVTMDDFFADLERSTTTSQSQSQNKNFIGVTTPHTHTPGLSNKPLPPPPTAKRGRATATQPDSSTTKDPFDPFA